MSSISTTPWSSPSSSPVLGPVDSSPFPSPHLTPCSLDDAPSLPTVPVLDPFAGSTKAKLLPRYERKTRPSTPPPPCSGSQRGILYSRSCLEGDFMAGNTSPDSPPHRTSRYVDREERLWEEALRRPFDTGIGHVDLSNQHLKRIPSSIGDLSGFFNTSEDSEQLLSSRRYFPRVNTEPAFTSSRTRSFGRTQSIVDSRKERHVLQLYLSGNDFTSLPSQLFTLQNLSVLSLRGNQLAELPGDICHLKNLRELNISLNRLKFLPWEIRDMTLHKLMLHPNPFLSPPPSPSQPVKLDHHSRRSLTRLASIRQESVTTTVSSVTTLLPPVPPLTELCFRLLLTPTSECPGAPLLITEYYDVPISDHWDIPLHIYATLSDCMPGLLRPRKQCLMDESVFCDGHLRPADHSGTTATCARREHHGNVFVRHASERYTWDKYIAGVDVGAPVPLRWRGCLQRCLDFLDEERSDGKEGEGEDVGDSMLEGEGEGEGDGMDVDLQGVVQRVQLGDEDMEEEFGD